MAWVIDSGKMKETGFDQLKGIASLEETWVSKANARQRKGRAGRVMSGTVMALYTSFKFNSLKEEQLPEIQRTSLDHLCLRIKLMTFLDGYSIQEVLEKVIQPPDPIAVKTAVQFLKSFEALDDYENLTSLGYHCGR